MLKGFFNLGNDNRTDLKPKNQYKIRLAMVLRNFENYKTQLKEFGVKDELIKMQDFTILMNLGGGVFTKWDNIQSAISGVFLEIENCLYLREKKIVIYEKTPDEILQNINQVNTYITNENDDETNRKYLAGVQENNNSPSYLTSSQLLDNYYNSLQNPNQDFFSRIIRNVASMYQPRIRNYHERMDYT